MYKRTDFFISLVFVLVFTFIGKAQSQERVTITGQIKNYIAQTNSTDNIEFSTYDLFLQAEMHYTTKIESNGNFEVVVPLYQPQSIDFKYIANFSAFAKPGDKIVIVLNAKNPAGTIIFKGEEAQYNNLHQQFTIALSNSLEEYNKHYVQNYEKVKDKPEQVKQFLLNSLTHSVAFLATFAVKNKLQQDFKDRIKTNLEYSTAFKLVEQGFGKENYPENYFEDIFKQFPVEGPEAVLSGMSLKYLHAYYKYLLPTINKEKYSAPPGPEEIAAVILKYNNTLSDTDKTLLLKVSSVNDNNKKLNKNDTIQFKNIVQNNWDLFQDKFPSKHPWVEYFISETDGQVRDIYLSWVLTSFIKADYLEVVKRYLKTYTSLVGNENLKSKVIQFYNEHEKELYPNAITNLEQANIKQVPHGHEDSLFNNIIAPYVGKVIYIDFWGTWCAPCIAEMPASRKLKEELKENDVVFLYLGVDSPETKWKQIISHLGIRGEHYLLSNDEYKLLQKQFQIYGIPRYILIDKRGLVNDNDAMRPSMPSLKDKIVKLAEK
ncbi:MAG: TlpA family protein disulfide reductase [Adhaeribacter sp.]